MASKKPALGRGLSALLDNANSYPQRLSNNDLSSEFFSEINVNSVEANPFQPRSNFDADALTDLSESIKIHGVIQPITVRRLNDNQYQLISGERRLRASKLAKKESIPAYIITTTDQGMIEMALIENVQREDLDAIEVAVSFKRLMEECNLNHEQVAERVSKQRSTITNYLRLLKLPAVIQMGIKNGQISMGHARALIAVDNPDLQKILFEKIVELGLSVRKTEDIVKNASFDDVKKLGKKRSPSKTSYEESLLQRTLSEKLKLNISIKKESSGKGKLTISFDNDADFSKLLDIFENL